MAALGVIENGVCIHIYTHQMASLINRENMWKSWYTSETWMTGAFTLGRCRQILVFLGKKCSCYTKNSEKKAIPDPKKMENPSKTPKSPYKSIVSWYSPKKSIQSHRLCQGPEAGAQLLQVEAGDLRKGGKGWEWRLEDGRILETCVDYIGLSYIKCWLQDTLW